MLVLLNNLVNKGFFVFTKKIIFLRFDVNKFFFWVYSKKIKAQTVKISKLKTFFF